MGDDPLFARAIGQVAWAKMPATYRAVHFPDGTHVLEGQAEITRGDGLLARMVALLFGFPPAGADVPVTVTMTEEEGGEHWLRNFAGKRFSSVLTAAVAGHVYERFGPFKFLLELPVNDGRMEMIVRKGWFLGLPMPKPLLPVSETAEFEQDGRFNFDVKLTAPLAGFVVRYRGWLVVRGD